MRLERGAAIAVLIFALAWLVWTLTEDQRAAATHRAELAAIMRRPDVQALLSEGNAVCPSQTDRYFWTCGTLLHLDHPPPGGLCSAPDSPRYIGDMGYPFLNWSMEARYDLPLSDGRACSGTTCAVLSVLPGGAFPSSAARQPPRIRPERPMWPDFDAVDTYGPWAPGVWAGQGGRPVWFYFGDLAPLDPHGHRPDITVLADHPDLPFGVKLVIPFGEKDRWRAHLMQAFDLLSRAAMSRQKTASCDVPPLGARMTLDPRNPYTVRDVADHLAGLDRPSLISR